MDLRRATTLFLSAALTTVILVACTSERPNAQGSAISDLTFSGLGGSRAPAASRLDTSSGNARSDSGAEGSGRMSPLQAEWAKQIIGKGDGGVGYYALCVDTRGNIYAAGEVWVGADFGNAVSAEAPSSGESPLLVKYDAKGNALWASTAAEAPSQSWFTCLAVDSLGNAYAAGRMDAGTLDFGGGVEITSEYQGQNMVLVKFDANGKALWARTVDKPDGETWVEGIAVDKGGNAYVAEYHRSRTQANFTQKAPGFFRTPGDGIAGMIVKFDSSGRALWVGTSTGEEGAAYYNAVAVDGSNNVYAAGYTAAEGQVSFGNGVSVQGSGYQSAVLVKYSPSGKALWARTEGEGGSEFRFVGTDLSGGVYAVGDMGGNWTYDFGNGVTVEGSAGGNPLVVKYDSNGTPLWARSQTGGSGRFDYLSAVTYSKNLLLVGSLGMREDEIYDFGNGVVADKSILSYRWFVLCYSDLGVAQWIADPVPAVKVGNTKLWSFCCIA